MFYWFAKVSRVKTKFFILSILILSVYLLLFYIFLEIRLRHKNNPVMVSSSVLPYVVVHIDLKGAPPKLSYLESLLPTLRNHGVNGLLMEYEDMFPYEGKLTNLSAKNCYKKTDLKKFVSLAVHSGFEIIPLVQTFGHLEYALKLKEFQHLREDSTYPDSICPSKVESQVFIGHILEQIINFHKAISPLKYFHIGCDEVYHINKCKECQLKSLPTLDLFLHHVKTTTDILKTLSSNTTVLIWDDMLRGMKAIKSNNIDYISNIEPVYWDYKPDLDVSHINLFKYHTKFDNIWAASAFKGADGRAATFPNMKNRFLNNLNWLKLISNYKFGGENEVYRFNGIILTGWSRYSHMDPVCELLPISLPSLFLNLHLINVFKEGFADNTANPDEIFTRYLSSGLRKSLHCKKPIDIDNFNSSQCKFDGNKMYTELKKIIHITTNIETQMFNQESRLSSLDYYSRLNSVNMNSVKTNIQWLNNTLNELLDVENKMIVGSIKYYNKEVIEEYVSFKTYSAKRVLNALLEKLQNYSKMRNWKRKSIKSNDTIIT